MLEIYTNTNSYLMKSFEKGVGFAQIQRMIRDTSGSS